MSDKLLSIIIPTYNRAAILPYTISLFKEQIKRNIDDVEFIVCNNASTDNTSEVLQEIHLQDAFFSIINYLEHFDIGNSIKRSANNGSGKFILLFGDDDVPAPMLVDYVLQELKSRPDVGALVLGKTEGFSGDELKIDNLVLPDNENTFTAYECHYAEDTTSFAEDNYYKMGFLSVDVIRRTCWERGINNYADRHLGFEFVAQMLMGVKGLQNIYINWPLVIQRHPTSKNNQRDWISLWPIYMYVGFPRLLIDLEKESVVSDWRMCFEKHIDQRRDGNFYIAMLGICKRRKAYLPYLEEMRDYQHDSQRKRLISAIISGGVKMSLYYMYYKFKYTSISHQFERVRRYIKRHL